jgi:hypothetical protein
LKPKEATMKQFIKFAAIATLAGACAIATAMPSQAANGRNAAAAIGFGAGAAVGAAAAGAAYNNSYYTGPGYVDSGAAYVEPSYAYEPAECRVIVRHHVNRFGERVSVRERVCE